MEALEGLRVVELAWAFAGPWTAAQLGMLGAEVIKVESHIRPDINRGGWDPFRLQWRDLDKGDYRFRMTSFNKMSITLNLSTPQGVELVRRLVRISDVVVENYRPGVMERLGLGYPALGELRPDLVMLSTSAFGQTGPWASYSGTAFHVSAVSGLGEATGYPDGPPSSMGTELDGATALVGAAAVLAALLHRERTGQGAYIDLSQMEAAVATLGEMVVEYEMNGRVPTRTGNRHPFMAPHNVYRCKGDDSWISIAVATEEEWQGLCRVMGRPALAQDPRFAHALARWRNQEELDRLLETWTANYNSVELTEMLQREGVAAIPVYSAAEVFSDPHLQQRGFFPVVEHPAGPHLAFAPPWKLSVTPAGIRHPAPLLGEHNRYVLGELLGLPERDILSLVEQRVIY